MRGGKKKTLQESHELQLSVSSWTCRCGLKEHILSHCAAFLIPIMKACHHYHLSHFIVHNEPEKHD